MAASANWSEAALAAFPWKSSGAMKAGVPSTRPSWVATVAEPGSLAIPKSTSTAAWPAERTMAFSGFTSRWRTPARWAASRASASSPIQRARLLPRTSGPVAR